MCILSNIQYSVYYAKNVETRFGCGKLNVFCHKCLTFKWNCYLFWI